MKKNSKSNLDEMQEQKLLKIEHNGCWFAFWALLAAILIQILIDGNSEEMMRTLVGEWLVFMCLAIYLGASCLKNGIWDRKLKADPKTNLICSALAGLVVGVFWFVRSYVKYHKLVGSIATAIVGFVVVFTLCIIALSITAAVYKKKVKKLEDEEENTDK